MAEFGFEGSNKKYLEGQIDVTSQQGGESNM